MKHPESGEWMYFEQSGPIYGENSAPVHWGEGTLTPFLVNDCGFRRGENHKCVYYHEARDLLMITQVDDFLMDGNQEDIEWADKMIGNRFDCKDLEYLQIGLPLDFMGIQVLLTDTHLHLSMAPFIDKMVAEMAELGLKLLKRKVSQPLSQPIDTEAPHLSPREKHVFLSGNGCVAWLANTTRLDVSHAFSRIGQHSAHPNTSAMQALVHTISYLEQHKHLTLAQRLFPEDVRISSVATPKDQQHGFLFYADTDHAGNSEVQNKRRSQNGAVMMVDEAPTYWHSKVSSVAFATPLIGEAHADWSSGAVEVYGAGNATVAFLDQYYLYDECGMKFPMPFKLGLDNTTAEAFAKGTVKRSKLKHIDCRQEWVQVLRDKNVMIPTHVDTEENLADIFTKILDPKPFTFLRDRMMSFFKGPSTHPS